MNESLSQLSGWVWVIRFLPGQNIFLTDDAQVLEEDGPVELALAKGFARGELGEITPRPAVTIRKVGPGPTNKTERNVLSGNENSRDSRLTGGGNKHSPLVADSARNEHVRRVLGV